MGGGRRALLIPPNRGIDPLPTEPCQGYLSDEGPVAGPSGGPPPAAARTEGRRAVSDTGEMQELPPDAEMPSGEMEEPRIQVEQDEMPSGSMEPEEVDA